MASNYHLGYKTNVVRTVSGQEVALSGTEATTWSARIKVITPDGNPGWINVYSTSNENPV